MEQIMNYVKPELLIVAIILYFVGNGIKKSEYIMDKFIPMLLGIFGILICALWVFAIAISCALLHVLVANTQRAQIRIPKIPSNIGMNLSMMYSDFLIPLPTK